MTFTQFVAGIMERLATIPELLVSLDYEPTSIQKTPAAYVLFDGYSNRTTAGQITTMPYRAKIRLLNKWQSNKECEAQMMPFVNYIPASIDADPQLGGRLVSGIASVPEATAGWVTIAGVEYRTYDFICQAIAKDAYGGGI